MATPGLLDRSCPVEVNGPIRSPLRPGRCWPPTAKGLPSDVGIARWPLPSNTSLNGSSHASRRGTSTRYDLPGVSGRRGVRRPTPPDTMRSVSSSESRPAPWGRTEPALWRLFRCPAPIPSSECRTRGRPGSWRSSRSSVAGTGLPLAAGEAAAANSVPGVCYHPLDPLSVSAIVRSVFRLPLRMIYTPPASGARLLLLPFLF